MAPEGRVLRVGVLLFAPAPWPLSALPCRYRVFCGRSLHRTDSGHSPWQREPLFVPPLALATPLAHSSGRSSTSPTTGEEQNPLSCNYGPLSAVRAEGTLSFLGQYVPRAGSSEPGPT